jgi:hypothetical protein
MKTRKIGTKVKMTDDAIENYGEKWKGVVFIVTHVAHSTKEHPGYDDGVSPEGLYDLKIEKTKEEIPFSLYDWELENA